MLDHTLSPRTPAEAEAHVEQDRARLARSLAALRAKLSPDGLIGEGVALVQRHAQPAIQRIDRTIRSNPLAVALTVGCLAWLVFGPKHATDDAVATDGGASGDALAGTKFEALTRWEDEGGPMHPAHETPAVAHSPDERWFDEATGLRRTALESLATLDHAAKRALAPAADLARDRAAVVAGYVADLTATFRQGLGSLSAEAQERIAAAREAAFTARHTVADAAHRAVEEYPMTVAFVSAALGAALAGALPTTDAERAALAGTGDRLLDEARRLLVEERDRAGEVAADLADGLKDDLRVAQARVSDAFDTLAHPRG